MLGECDDCGGFHAPETVCQMRKLRERIEVLEDQMRDVLRDIARMMSREALMSAVTRLRTEK